MTEARLDYEGSITLDQEWLEATGILPFEQVHVYNISNGNRLITYAIEGTRGQGDCCLNGAAARLVSPGDLVIIVAYCQLEAEEARRYEPKVLLLGEGNRVKNQHSIRGQIALDPGAPLVDRQ